MKKLKFKKERKKRSAMRFVGKKAGLLPVEQYVSVISEKNHHSKTTFMINGKEHIL